MLTQELVARVFVRIEARLIDEGEAIGGVGDRDELTAARQRVCRNPERSVRLRKLRGLSFEQLLRFFEFGQELDRADVAIRDALDFRPKPLILFPQPCQLVPSDLRQRGEDVRMLSGFRRLRFHKHPCAGVRLAQKVTVGVLPMRVAIPVSPPTRIPSRMAPSSPVSGAGPSIPPAHAEQTSIFPSPAWMAPIISAID